MVKYIRRIDGKFEVAEHDFLNFYYELVYRDMRYANIHVQLATDEKFAYCHVYVERFTAGIAREIKKDWGVITGDMHSFDIERAVGTKVGGIRLWKKFVQLLGVGADDIGPSIINNEPCMMAVMEL
jgi:hypothetical protein